MDMKTVMAAVRLASQHVFAGASLVIPSSTEGSTKRYTLSVDDEGVLSIVDETGTKKSLALTVDADGNATTV